MTCTSWSISTKAWTLNEALQRCHAIDEYLGLTWIEEPIVYDNLDGFAQLAAELKTPIQIGENFYGPREVHKALQKKACDLVMPDFMRIGGVTGWLKVSGHRRSRRRSDVNTSLSGGSCAHDAGYGNRALARVAKLGGFDLQKQYEIRDGLLHIPNVPGIGLEWNEDAVANLLVEQ